MEDVAAKVTPNLIKEARLAELKREIMASEALAYKGMMLSGLPNVFVAFGYTNASWTLKADLTANFVCRLFKFMDKRGYRFVSPQHDPAQSTQPFLDFTSGYVQRGADALPRSGNRAPWVVTANYTLDRQELRDGALEDDMVFSRPHAVSHPALAEAAE